MSCRRVLRLLPLYVGGDLVGDRASVVEDHVTDCESCAAELKRYEQSRQSLFALKTTPSGPAPDLWPAIRLRIGARRPARRRLPLRAAAALLLAIGAASILYYGFGERRAPPDLPGPSEGEVVAAEPAPAVSIGTGEFILAEVGPATTPDSASFTEFPSVGPADTERSDWDEF